MAGERQHRNRGIGWEAVHLAVDDHSRVSFGQVLVDETALSCVQFLRDAVAYNWCRPHCALNHQPPMSRIPAMSNLLGLNIQAAPHTRDRPPVARRGGFFALANQEVSFCYNKICFGTISAIVVGTLEQAMEKCWKC